MVQCGNGEILIDWSRFFDLATFGRIATTSLPTCFDYLVRTSQRILHGTRGEWSHTGIIGHDAYMYNMRAGGLKYTWLGRYLARGGRVGIWQPRGIICKYDTVRAISRIKQLGRFHHISYDFSFLLSLTLLSNPRKMVCSKLVQCYLIELYRYHPQIKVENETAFIPDDVGSFCDLVAVIEGGRK